MNLITMWTEQNDISTADTMSSITGIAVDTNLTVSWRKQKSEFQDSRSEPDSLSSLLEDMEESELKRQNVCFREG